MSSRQPKSVTYSLDEFSRNGSQLRHNRDGWGIAFSRDREALFVKEPRPASDNPWVKFIAGQSIKTTTAIAHVRYATRGKLSMENTHPFRRVSQHLTRIRPVSFVVNSDYIIRPHTVEIMLFLAGLPAKSYTVLKEFEQLSSG